jgi:hypothetical protein
MSILTHNKITEIFCMANNFYKEFDPEVKNIHPCPMMGKSAAIAVCNNKRIKRNKVFRDLAKGGKSTMGWFYGFKPTIVENFSWKCSCFIKISLYL